jgi:hypothetical protein
MVAAYEINRTSGTVSRENSRRHPARPETMLVTAGPRRAANVAQPIAHRKDGMRRGRVVSARRMFRAGNSYRALSTPMGRPTTSDTTATRRATTVLFCRALTNAAPPKVAAEFIDISVRHKRGMAGSTAIKSRAATPMLLHFPGRSSNKQEIISTGS